MKATVTDKCVGCGLCAEICPEVFEMNGGGKAVVIADPVPADAEDDCRQAADGCPVDAIDLGD